ncbi:MAG: ABC transporter permease [Coriobacteriia bacterium]|nr:ABC transporter permease [Coriobacteriia bacterium]
MNTIIIDGLALALPLLVIAIGGIFSERSGIINLALEGLLGFGAFCGALFAYSCVAFHWFAPDSLAPMYLSFIVAAAGGALFAVIHAMLCVKFRANQVISGVVINILSVAMTGFLTSQINKTVFSGPSSRFDLMTAPRLTVPVLSKIPVLGAVFTRFYPFEVLILILLVVFWFILYRTRFGIHVRAAGDNPQALDAAGIEVSRVRFVAVLISGALAGIGGMCFAYSIFSYFSGAIYLGYGYLAIAALIFGNWKIMPTFAACLLFGFAQSGASQLVLLLKVNSSVGDLAMIVPYALTLILLAFFSKHNRAPRSLGEIYDKSKR